jgi:hypothetical protein
MRENEMSEQTYTVTSEIDSYGKIHTETATVLDFQIAETKHRVASQALPGDTVTHKVTKN